MKATAEIMKGIFLGGNTMAKSIILFPLSISDLYVYTYYAL